MVYRESVGCAFRRVFRKLRKMRKDRLWSLTNSHYITIICYNTLCIITYPLCIVNSIIKKVKSRWFRYFCCRFPPVQTLTPQAKKPRAFALGSSYMLWTQIGEIFALRQMWNNTLLALWNVPLKRNVNWNKSLTPAGISHGEAIFHTAKRYFTNPEGIYFVEKSMSKRAFFWV